MTCETKLLFNFFDGEGLDDFNGIAVGFNKHDSFSWRHMLPKDRMRFFDITKEGNKHDMNRFNL